MRSAQPFSSGVRSPLALLHRTQQATRFSQLSRPPRLRGRTWSTVVAWPAQYAHRCASRRSTPRRLTGTARPWGARTYRASRITEGRGRVRVPPTTGLPPSAMTVALPARTSTRARRNETTASGSYPALSTRVRTRVTPFRSGRAPGWWRHDLPPGGVPGDWNRRRTSTVLLRATHPFSRKDRMQGQDDGRRRPPRGTTPSRQCAAVRGGTAQACAAALLRTASRTGPPDGWGDRRGRQGRDGDPGWHYLPRPESPVVSAGSSRRTGGERGSGRSPRPAA